MWESQCYTRDNLGASVYTAHTSTSLCTPGHLKGFSVFRGSWPVQVSRPKEKFLREISPPPVWWFHINATQDRQELNVKIFKTKFKRST